MNNKDVVDRDESVKLLRKCRKKLRQIERLEASGRELTIEEKVKLNSKPNIRAKIQEILSSINRNADSFDSIPEEQESESDDNNSQFVTVEKSEIPVVTHKTSEDLFLEPRSVQPAAKKFVQEHEISLSPVKAAKTATIEVTEHSAEEKRKKSQSKIQKAWKNKQFEVTWLDGHNDMICDVDANEGWLVSGSRDTSVKLWNLDSKTEVRNMSSHTGAVTSVQLIDSNESDRLRKLVTSTADELRYDINVKVDDGECLLLTASTDCSIKLWLLPKGYLIKSIYNYSPVICLLHCFNTVFAGSDSGKLTAYNIVTSCQMCDVMIHSDSITSLKCKGIGIMTSSLDGSLRLWDIYDDNDKRTTPDNINGNIDVKMTYCSKDSLNTVDGRQILSSCLYKHMIIYGDDGINIKALDVDTGNISRYSNHRASAPGFTDSLFIFNDLLFSTSHDLDTGEGSLNVRSLKDEDPFMYLVTLHHPDIPRLTSTTSSCTSTSTRFVTGGTMLLVWEEFSNGKANFACTFDDDGKIYVKGRNVAELSKPSSPSDAESDFTEDEAADSSSWWWTKPKPTGPTSKSSTHVEGDSDSESSEQSVADSPPTQSSSWTSWCLLI